MNRFVDKNKYGGYTWEIKVPPEFKFCFNGTSERSFFVELKKLAFFGYKTIDSYHSDLRLEDLIRFAVNKAFESEFNNGKYTWSVEKAMLFVEQMEMQYKLSKYFSANDIVDSNGFTVVDKPGNYNLFLLKEPEFMPWGKYQIHYKARTPSHFLNDKDDDGIVHNNLFYECRINSDQIEKIKEGASLCRVDYYTSQITGDRILGIVGLEL